MDEKYFSRSSQACDMPSTGCKRLESGRNTDAGLRERRTTKDLRQAWRFLHERERCGTSNLGGELGYFLNMMIDFGPTVAADFHISSQRSLSALLPTFEIM